MVQTSTSSETRYGSSEKLECAPNAKVDKTGKIDSASSPWNSETVLWKIRRYFRSMDESVRTASSSQAEDQNSEHGEITDAEERTDNAGNGALIACSVSVPSYLGCSRRNLQEDGFNKVWEALLKNQPACRRARASTIVEMEDSFLLRQPCLKLQLYQDLKEAKQIFADAMKIGNTILMQVAEDNLKCVRNDVRTTFDTASEGNCN